MQNKVLSVVLWCVVALFATAANAAPIALPQAVETSAGTAIPIVLEGVGSSLTYSIVTPPNPTLGSVELPVDSNIATYTPVANQSGVDKFTFSVSDGQSTSETATVSIVVRSANSLPSAAVASVSVESPPTAIAPTKQPVSLSEDGKVTVSLKATDVDGKVTYKVKTEPTQGIVTVSGSKATYKPVLNYAGSDSFSFVANDGGEDSDPAAVALLVKPINDKPTAEEQTGLTEVKTSEDTPVEIVLAGDDPEDGNNVTFKVKTSTSLKGRLLPVPDKTATYLYTPDANYNGKASFTFTVKDSTGLESKPATVSIAVSPVADAPVAKDQEVAPIKEDAAAKRIRLSATDPDSSSSSLKYVLKSLPEHGTLMSSTNASAPSLTKDTVLKSAVVYYKPLKNYAGADSFTFIASDGSLTSVTPATVKLTMTPVNDAPVANPNNESALAYHGQVTPIRLPATDADGDNLFYLREKASSSKPAPGGTLAEAGGFGTVAGVNTLYYTPKAGATVDYIWFKVKDAKLISPAAKLTINIATSPNNPPTANAGDDVTVAEGMPVTLSGSGFDADSDTLTYRWLNGTTQVATTPDYTFTAPTVTADTPYTYTLKVEDSRGAVATDTVTVTVKNFAFTDASLRKCNTLTDAQLKVLTNFSCDGVDLSTADLSQLSQLTNLKTLDLSHSKLTNISGLSGLTQLTSLDLHFNTISNLVPLAGMTQLLKLDLGFNEVSDISKLGGMDKLQELYLDANQITTLGTALANKPALVKLSLDDNRISDITGLSTAPSLTHIGLGYNQLANTDALMSKPLQVVVLDANKLTNISRLAGLKTTLQKLYLRANDLTDAAISSLSGLTNLQELELGFNSISSTSSFASFTNLIRLGLEYNDISNVATLSGLTKLKDLALEHNQLVSTNGISSMAALNGLLRLEHNSLLDDDMTALAAMGNSYSLRLDDNCLGSFPFPTRIKVYGEDWQFPAARCGGTAPVAIGKSSEIYKNTATTIRLDATDPNGDPLTYTLESMTTTGGTLKNMNGSTATVGNLTGNEVQFVPTNGYLGSGGSFTFSATDSNTEKSQIVTVNIRVIDPVLAECFGASIPSDTDLQAMTRVDSCAGKSLTDISALPFYFPNLQVLFLGGNTITDYSPLQNLPKLTGLSLKGNNLDASALAILDGLTGMRILELDECQLDNADLASLSGLTNLTDLYLNTNSITDIVSLSDLTGLVSLKLASNSIDDLTPLSGMSHLSNLVLNNNRVGEKQASNMNILSGLGNLTYFEFEKNGITDVSALTSLSKLQVLSLRNNRLMTADAFKSIPQTQSLALYVAGNCLGSAALSGWPAHVTLDTAGVQRTAVSGACPAPP